MASRGRKPGADITVAAILAATGGTFWLFLYRNPIGQPIFGVGSDTLPSALALVISCLAAVLALRLALIGGGAPEAPAEVNDATGREGGTGRSAESTDNRPGSLRLLALVAIGIGFCVALRPLGFLVAGGALALFTALLFGQRKPVTLALLALGLPYGVAIFFEKAMVIYLPAGQLF